MKDIGHKEDILKDNSHYAVLKNVSASSCGICNNRLIYSPLSLLTALILTILQAKSANIHKGTDKSKQSH